MAESNEALYELRQVRKTYGVRKKIPERVFRECRLSDEYKPQGTGWRSTCGAFQICRQECPRCWALYIENMTLRRGLTTSILGHSGSGKTTLLYLLALLHSPDPDSGRLALRFKEGSSRSVHFSAGLWRDEIGLAPAFDRIRANRFGFVFQAGHLSSHLTALQNVALSPALAGLPSKELTRRAESILEKIDFPRDRRRALPRHLSGGEYQRVAVARSLAADPEVLFADEPTGNLDPVTGRAVMELLDGWRAEKPNRSLILVTHNIEHALEFSDEIYVLSGGEVSLFTTANDARHSEIEEALRRRPAAEVPSLVALRGNAEAGA